MTSPLKRFLISTLLHDFDLKTFRVCLNVQETHHLKHVLRMKEGTVCFLFDQKGNEFRARLEKFLSDGRSEFKLMERFLGERIPHVRLTVAQAIPQHRKMDEIARKAAELGISELIPLVTERTVVRPKLDQGHKMVARWQRIAEQTVKQSRLRGIPQILPLTSSEDLWSHVERFEHAFLLHPDDQAEPLLEWMKKNEYGESRHQDVRILLIIGPEGGFSPNEMKQAKTRGVTSLRMGEGILKTDTAFTIAAGIFQLM